MSDEFTLRETTEDVQDMSFDEIEAAYLRALEAADAVEAAVASSGVKVDSNAEDTVASHRDTSATVSAAAGHLPAAESPRLTQEQVLEALLFVGGEPLSTKRLGDVLGCDNMEKVEELIEKLTLRYDGEGRPYEVRLVEGGYELSLRPEFDTVRNRVFGQGPKEVKLTQDALEILAFVAYQQPVTIEAVNATEKANAAGLLRQLIRRELVGLKRDADGGTQTYHTTPRFLQLFGLATLDDLPLAVDFDFK